MQLLPGMAFCWLHKLDWALKSPKRTVVEPGAATSFSHTSLFVTATQNTGKSIMLWVFSSFYYIFDISYILLCTNFATYRLTLYILWLGFPLSFVFSRSQTYMEGILCHINTAVSLGMTLFTNRLFHWGWHCRYIECFTGDDTVVT